MNTKKKGSTTGGVLGAIAVLAVLGIGYWAINKSPSSNTYVPNSQTPAVNTTSQTSGGVPVVSTQSASYVSQSTAVLNGQVNPDGVQTSYWYEYGLTSSLGSFSRAQLIGGGNANYSAPTLISGLSANTTYSYRIVAQNQYGTVDGQVSSFQTTSTPPVTYLPPTVGTRDASNISQTSVTLNGTLNPIGSTTNYWFEYGQDFGLGHTTSTLSAGAGRTNIAISSAVTGLESGKTYYYRLNAQNAYGTVNGNISVFATQPVNPPPPPVGKAPASVTAAATSIGSTTATLHGQANPNGSATTYYFEYGKSTPFGLFSLDSKTDAKSAGATTAVVAVSGILGNLDANSTYYYRLVTDNQYGTTRGAIYSFTTTKK